MSEIYVVTSGKGGVGKTTTTANLGVGFAMRGKSVVLIDTDTGLRNLDLLLGLENRIMYDLVDVTSGRVPYKKALVRHKKYDSLFLLPTSQVKDKSAVNPEELAVLCEELRRSYDVIIIDCPAGIEQGFKTAIVAADTAIVVTMPEISAVRDADKIIGELGRADKEDIRLIVNRIRPKMIEKGDMLDMDDIDEILSVGCIGQIPDDEMVVTSTNRGEPCVTMPDSPAGQAYLDVGGRLSGEGIPFREFALKRLLGKKESSGDVARRRLQLVIINDRANVSPEIMDNMRAEIIQVISKYMYIDTREMEFALENENDTMALVVNIPVVSVQHGGSDISRRRR